MLREFFVINSGEFLLDLFKSLVFHLVFDGFRLKNIKFGILLGLEGIHVPKVGPRLIPYNILQFFLGFWRPNNHFLYKSDGLLQICELLFKQARFILGHMFTFSDGLSIQIQTIQQCGLQELLRVLPLLLEAFDDLELVLALLIEFLDALEVLRCLDVQIQTSQIVFLFHGGGLPLRGWFDLGGLGLL